MHNKQWTTNTQVINNEQMSLNNKQATIDRNDEQWAIHENNKQWAIYRTISSEQ